MNDMYKAKLRDIYYISIGHIIVILGFWLLLGFMYLLTKEINYIHLGIALSVAMLGILFAYAGLRLLMKDTI